MRIPLRIISKANSEGKLNNNIDDIEFKLIDLEDIKEMLYVEKFIKYDPFTNNALKDKINEISNQKNEYLFNEKFVTKLRDAKRSFCRSISIHSAITTKDGQKYFALETITEIYAIIGRMYVKGNKKRLEEIDNNEDSK